MDTIPISEFKARCLAILEKVRRTGRPVLVTRRGEPIAEVGPPISTAQREGWLGCAEGTGRILGDIISPLDDVRWEAMGD